MYEYLPNNKLIKMTLNKHDWVRKIISQVLFNFVHFSTEKLPLKQNHEEIQGRERAKIWIKTRIYRPIFQRFERLFAKTRRLALARPLASRCGAQTPLLPLFLREPAGSLRPDSSCFFAPASSSRGSAGLCSAEAMTAPARASG